MRTAPLNEAVLNSSGNAAKHARASGQEYCSSKKAHRQEGRPDRFLVPYPA